jgi:hypothetical protein
MYCKSFSSPSTTLRLAVLQAETAARQPLADRGRKGRATLNSVNVVRHRWRVHLVAHRSVVNLPGVPTSEKPQVHSNDAGSLQRRTAHHLLGHLSDMNFGPDPRVGIPPEAHLPAPFSPAPPPSPPVGVCSHPVATPSTSTTCIPALGALSGSRCDCCRNRASNTPRVRKRTERGDFAATWAGTRSAGRLSWFLPRRSREPRALGRLLELEGSVLAWWLRSVQRADYALLITGRASGCFHNGWRRGLRHP